MDSCSAACSQEAVCLASDYTRRNMRVLDISCMLQVKCMLAFYWHKCTATCSLNILELFCSYRAYALPVLLGSKKVIAD